MSVSKRQLGLGTKANVVFCLIGAIFIVIAATAYFGLNRFSSELSSLMSKDIRIRAQLRSLQSDMLMLLRNEKDYMLRHDDSYVEKHKEIYDSTLKSIESVRAIDVDYQAELGIGVLSTSLTNYRSEFEKYVDHFKVIGDANSGLWNDSKVLIQKIEQDLGQEQPKAYSALLKVRTSGIYYLMRPGEEFKTDLISSFKEASETFSAIDKAEIKEKVTKGLQAYIDTFSLIFARYDDLKQTEDRMRASVHQFETEGQSILQKVIGYTQKTEANLTETGKKVELFIMSVAVVALAILMFFSFYFSSVIKKIAKLSISLQESSDSTEKSGLNVNDMSQKVSASVTQQASAIQETVSTLHELTAMVNRSVDNAKTSNEKAQSGHSVAIEGKSNVDDMIAAMNQINASNKDVMEQMTQSNREIGQIIQVINEISQKTNVINDIVFQTKLLSFNASVEAARAGEHGKGFAVVAEEVGSLAQMSGSASKEIDELLKKSIKQVESIVAKTQNSVEQLMANAQSKIDNGVQVAHKCGASLDQVVRNVDEVMRMMSEISSASQEQAEGIHNITTAMNELDEATHSNSSVASETETCARSLQEEANKLNAVVGELKLQLLGGQNKVLLATTTKAEKRQEHQTQSESAPLKFQAKAEAKITKKESQKTPSDKENQATVLQLPKKAEKLVSNGVPSEEDPRFKEVI